MAADLPELVPRYFLHAIQPGTPLARVVRLAMGGEIRFGPEKGWLPFRASQVLTTLTGFVWDACVGKRLPSASARSPRSSKAASAKRGTMSGGQSVGRYDG
jgi:hypothetical protein